MGTLSDVTSERTASDDPTSLGPQQRLDALSRLRATTPESPLDVLIVGGGVVGCGAALDAAARGLQVGLVEAGDLAIGTSSRSSRLAHGGLRYLEHGEFALVHEALTERGLLLERLAPHLVRPVPFLLPGDGRGAALLPGCRGGALRHAVAGRGLRRHHAPSAHLVPGGGARAGPGTAGGRDGGGGALPRRPDRRRPPRRGAGPHRVRPWSGDRDGRAGDRAAPLRARGAPAHRQARRQGRTAAGQAGHGGARPRPGDRGADRGPCPGGALRRRGLDRRPRRDGDGHGGAGQRSAEQGRAPGGPAARLPLDDRGDRPHPTVRAVPAALERALAGGHDRHRRHGQP